MRLNHSVLEWTVGTWAVVAALVAFALLQRHYRGPAPAGETPPAATTPAAPLQSRPALSC